MPSRPRVRRPEREAAVVTLLHQGLLKEATRHGTWEVLRLMPAEHSPELEQAIREGVRLAVLYYAARLERMSRHFPALNYEKERA
jgi:hypothetical protein